ncbi:hypothetical protein ACA910_015468 [Epithemia clementina (nom. ined.)]
MPPAPFTSIGSGSHNDSCAIMARSISGATASTATAKSGGKNAAASTMSLYQKYSDLTSGIENARSERGKLEEHMGKLEDEINRLDQVNQEIHHDTQDAHDDAIRHQTETQSSLADALSALKTKNDGMEDTQNALQVRKRALHKFFLDYQNRFLKESRDFRRQCKGLRQQATAAGLPHAFHSAFAIAILDAKQDSCLPFDVADNNHSQVLEYCENADAMPQGDEEAMESFVEEFDDDDETLRNTFKSYQEEKVALLSLQKKVDQARRLQQHAANERSGAVARRDKLQGQLDRILQDNAKMANEIREIHRDTEESKTLAETFSQQTDPPVASQHQQCQQQPLSIQQAPSKPLVPRTNPYLKKSNLAPKPAVPPADLRLIVLGTASSSGNPTPQDQRPSKSRLRRNNNFGSSFLISGEAMNGGTPGQENYSAAVDQSTWRSTPHHAVHARTRVTPSPAYSFTPMSLRDARITSNRGLSSRKNLDSVMGTELRENYGHQDEDLIARLVASNNSTPHQQDGRPSALIDAPESTPDIGAGVATSSRDIAIERLLQEEDDDDDALLSSVGLAKRK